MGRVEGRPMVELDRWLRRELVLLRIVGYLQTTVYVPTLPRPQIQRPRKVQTAPVSSLGRDGTENGGLAC